VKEEQDDNTYIEYVLDDEDSTEREIELVQRLGDSLAEITRLMDQLANYGDNARG
jgi:hypothetical protein